MDSTYKTQLMSKLDSVTALEASGYGATYRKDYSHEVNASVYSAIACGALMLVLIISAAILA